MSPAVRGCADIHHQLRPRRSRCKTGCLCCRLRKKKCDEIKPSCTSCSRLGLICSWPTSNEFAWRRRMGLSSSDDDNMSNIGEEETGQYGNAPSPHRNREPQTHSSPDFTFQNTPARSMPCALYSAGANSSRLMQVYVEQIVPRFLCTPKDYCNPFLQDVLPMASSDVLVMNAVLALGGSTRDVSRPVTREEEKEVLQCYGQAIKELKLGLTKWTIGGQGEWEGIRMFLTLLLLCHYEIIRGNKKGHMFHHLRASRVFAPVIYSFKDGQWSSLVRVLLENYAYFELCSSLRLIPDEIDIEAASQSVVPQLENLRKLNTFGVMFGSASEIFKYVPDICELALRRKVELANGEDLQCEETFQRLKTAITEWDSGYDESHADPIFTQGKIAAAIISQNALFLFLMSSYLQNQEPDQQYLRETSQPLVDTMVELLPILRQTTFCNTSFWPVIVTASYAMTETQRQKIMEYLMPIMPVITRAKEVLQWIWDEPHETFGLSGMAKVIGSHCTSYCFG